eukprot:7165787-Karenia_brevis.AAC.1
MQDRQTGQGPQGHEEQYCDQPRPRPIPTGENIYGSDVRAHMDLVPIVQEGPPGPDPTGAQKYHHSQHGNEKGPPQGNGALT